MLSTCIWSMSRAMQPHRWGLSDFHIIPWYDSWHRHTKWTVYHWEWAGRCMICQYVTTYKLNPVCTQKNFCMCNLWQYHESYIHVTQCQAKHNIPLKLKRHSSIVPKEKVMLFSQQRSSGRIHARMQYYISCIIYCEMIVFMTDNSVACMRRKLW